MKQVELAISRRLEEVKGYAFVHMAEKPYHNTRHIFDVAKRAEYLAQKEGMIKEIPIIVTAALLHDIVYCIGASDNEQRSSQVASDILPSLGYSEKDIQEVKKMILATRVPTNPRGMLQRIICDADSDNLGRDDFLIRNEELRLEFGIKDKQKWLRDSLAFLEKHKYYTGTEMEEREEGLVNNIRILRGMIR